jgi:hypothetical protein
MTLLDMNGKSFNKHIRKLPLIIHKEIFKLEKNNELFNGI